MVISGSTSTASRSPWIKVEAVGDHSRRDSPGGRSSETAGFDGATYTEYSRAVIIAPFPLPNRGPAGHRNHSCYDNQQPRTPRGIAAVSPSMSVHGDGFTQHVGH